MDYLLEIQVAIYHFLSVGVLNEIENRVLLERYWNVFECWITDHLLRVLEVVYSSFSTDLCVYYLLPLHSSPFICRNYIWIFLGQALKTYSFFFASLLLPTHVAPKKFRKELNMNMSWVAIGSRSLDFKCQKGERECCPYCSLTQDQTDKIILLFRSSCCCGWSRSLASKCFWHYMLRTLLLLMRCLLQFYFHLSSFHPQITHNIQGQNLEMSDIK